jgi:hypothetical protein
LASTSSQAAPLKLDLARSLKSGLKKIPVEQLARKSGFQQRRAKKIEPLVFLKSALLLCTQSHISLTVWAVLIGLLSHQVVSKQAVFGRLTRSAVEFLKAVLAWILIPIPQRSGQRLAKVLGCFSRILVQDSTTVKLTEKLAEFFAGGSNQHGKTPGVLRIQGLLDLCSQRWLHFGLSSYLRNDQKASPDILPYVRKNDLILRDLGYFAIHVLQQIVELKAFFLSRYYHRTAVLDPEGRPIDLLKHLRKQSINGMWDGWVRIGKKEKLPVRLVALRVPGHVAAERRRKARAHLKNRCQLSKEYLALQDWTIYLTTVPQETLGIKQIAALYGQRWQIEMVFKSWKSHFKLELLSEEISKEQLEAVIYGKLIFIALIQPQLVDPSAAQPEACCYSPLKLCLFISEYFLVLFFQSEKIQLSVEFPLQLQRHSCYEKRKRRNIFQNLLALC